MAHRPQPNRALAALRTLLTVLAATTALAGCYSTSPPPDACTTEFAPVCGDEASRTQRVHGGRSGRRRPCGVHGQHLRSGRRLRHRRCRLVPRCTGVDAGVPPACLPGERRSRFPRAATRPEPARRACATRSTRPSAASTASRTATTVRRAAPTRRSRFRRVRTVCTPVHVRPSASLATVDAAGCSTRGCNLPPMCPLCDLYARMAT